MLSARTAVVHSVHSGHRPCRCQTWSFTASVHQRLSGIWACQLTEPKLQATSSQHAQWMSRPGWKPVVSVWIRQNTGRAWLGSQHLLSRFDIVQLPILSSCIRVQDTARDLGVVIHNRLSLSEHVASVSRSGYYIPNATVAACGPVFVGRCHQDVSPGFHCQSPGLL